MQCICDGVETRSYTRFATKAELSNVFHIVPLHMEGPSTIHLRSRNFYLDVA
jgi:hypothetical protein